MLNIPRELEHYITVVRVPLPQVDEIKEILGNELADVTAIVEMSKGLEAIDIKNIASYVFSSVPKENVNERINLFQKKKADMVNKTGFLAIETALNNEGELGGYQALKSWLNVAKSSIGDPTLFPKGNAFIGYYRMWQISLCKSSCRKARITFAKNGIW